jgi:uncharacterized protein YndB with AHSA1/START domain
MRFKTLIKRRKKMANVNQNEIAAPNELLVSRILNAPRDLVFSVWTDPKHIAQWWGPEGFTNTIHKMDVKPGGEWDLVMHGPDGTNYKNKTVFVEVVKNERLVYDHVSGPRFRGIATFEVVGNKTRLTIRMIFETTELRDNTVKQFGADKGLIENVDKLERYVQSAFVSQD